MLSSLYVHQSVSPIPQRLNQLDFVNNTPPSLNSSILSLISIPKLWKFSGRTDTNATTRGVHKYCDRTARQNYSNFA
jgi:hypothetical protein